MSFAKLLRATQVVGAVIWAVSAAGSAFAEDFWVQIEAHETEDQSAEVAASKRAEIPNIAGFIANSGLYAVAAGPYGSREEADAARREMRRAGLLPPDAYVTKPDLYAEQFYPVVGTVPVAEAEVVAAPVETPVAAVPAIPAEETLDEAVASERALDTEARKALQEAMAWAGVYSARVDGAFGAGTRRSMSAWQALKGYPETGVLTTAQRAQLLAEVAAERAELGLSTITDVEAGIEVAMPLGLVKFDRYDAPFAHYAPINGSEVTVLLISQQGDQNSLFGLYDILQTLEIVPLEGARERDRNGFSIDGSNAQITSHTRVGLKSGLIKGFTLVYPTAKAEKMARVLAAMEKSLGSVSDTAMSDALGQPSAVSSEELMAGLDVRRPVFTRSGFYVDAKGAVATASAGLSACERVTVEGAEATIETSEGAMALLRPAAALAPRQVAAFQTAMPRAGSDIAAAGFSYGGALSAPVVSFGQFGSAEGMDGEADQARLTLKLQDGDAGGPVFDPSGAVVGMILPREADAKRLLPEDLALALQGTAMAPVLAKAGIPPAAALTEGALAAEDLSAIARGVTVQVSCWN